MNDCHGKSIYILYGVAGIGKSTVAKTVAEHAAKDGTLGGTFFFSRDEDKRKKAKSLFTTLAYHLAYYYPVIAERVKVALAEDPEVVERDPIQQFNRLIAKPLQIPVGGENPILLVVDALDECEEEDAKAILSLLAQEVPHISRLKVIITARPERHIRSIFSRDHNHDQFHLHDIDQSIVEADIRTYLEFRLSAEEILNALPDLRLPIWQPTKVQMDTLVGMCGKLFIIAATATTFILDGKHANPARRFAVLLHGVSATDLSGTGHNMGMDKMYLGIICAAQPDPVGDWAAHFRAVVGTIVLLCDPLPCDALAQLIGVGVNDILGTLSNLHSLLSPSADTQTFRVHHKSFPDFISDPFRCTMDPQFWINRTGHNFRIALRCLHIMDGLLKPNLCGLEPNEWHKDQLQILHHNPHTISPCLAYACTYWASHLVAALKGGAVLSAEGGGLVERFASTHLMTWLEVLSIIGRMDMAYTSLDMVRTRGQFPSMTYELFNDGWRFIHRSPGILHSLPMQIYNSALPFTPRNTALFRAYGGLRMNDVDVIYGSETDWDPAIAVLKGHSSEVMCVTFSADGSRLASASNDCTIGLWDGRTGYEFVALEGHSDTVNCVAFSADNSRLASGSEDRTVRLWDGGTGRHIRTLVGHSDMVYSVAFSADGSTLASASSDDTIRLWNSRTGHFIAPLKGHSATVCSVMFSPVDSTLASASDDGTLRLWDSRTGRCIAASTSDARLVYSVAFSPDGSKLASADDDGTIRLWNARTCHCIITVRGHSDVVTSVAFSADGLRLVSGSWDKTVRLWHGETGVHIATLEGHSDCVRSVAFSPDGSRFASASDDGTIRLWDSSKRGHITTSNHRRPSGHVSLSPDGSIFAVSCDDDTIQLLDGATGIHITALTSSLGPESCLAFSTDSSQLASGSDTGTIRLWDVRSGRCTAVLVGHSSRIHSVAFSADSSRLASVSVDRTARLWDSSSGICITTLQSGGTLSVKFSSDGSVLASASYDEPVRLWNGRTGTCLATLNGHSHGVTSVEFSADNSTLASASSDHTVRLWDVGTGGHIATLDGHAGTAGSVAFSTDCSKPISWSFDSLGNTVFVWDITDSTQPYVLCDKSAVDIFYLSAHNRLFLLEIRTNPTLCGLTVLDLGKGSPFDTRVICWFPPDISPRKLVVHPAALTVAVTCKGGRVLLLDISKASIL